MTSLGFTLFFAFRVMRDEMRLLCKRFATGWRARESVRNMKGRPLRVILSCETEITNAKEASYE